MHRPAALRSLVALAAIVLLPVVGCTISPASGPYSCRDGNRCPSGQVCGADFVCTATSASTRAPDAGRQTLMPDSGLASDDQAAGRGGEDPAVSGSDGESGDGAADSGAGSSAQAGAGTGGGGTGVDGAGAGPQQSSAGQSGGAGLGDNGGAGSAGSDDPMDAGMGAGAGAGTGAGSDPTGAGMGAGTGGAGGTGEIGAMEPCSSSMDCGGAECLKQGWCAISCNDNSRCGKSSSGGQNLCEVDASDLSNGYCYPGCVSDSDCAPYAKTTCQPLLNNEQERTCDLPSGTGWPCANDLNCESALICIDSAWCSPSQCTSDADCGKSPTNQPNLCFGSSTVARICFPGCASDNDCQPFPGSTCQTILGASGTACFKVPVGFPCKQESDCGHYHCTGSPGWCSPEVCSDDPECGTGISGVQGHCVPSVQGTKICFPGCTANNDCSAYPGTHCATLSSGIGSVCEAVSIADPCDSAQDCGSVLNCAGPSAWCTRACMNDADCGDSPMGFPNKCEENQDGDFTCFPGCVANSDCSAYSGAVCDDGSCTF